MSRRARPWRAVSYVDLGPFGRQKVGHASAKTREGLDSFVDRAEAGGFGVTVWEVLPHPAIVEAAELSAATVG